MKNTDSSSSRVSLRRLVVLPVLILAVLATLIAGLLTLRSGEIALNNVSQALRMEISHRIQIKLDNYLSHAEMVCNTTADILGAGFVNPGDIEEVRSILITKIKSYSDITSVYFGNPEGGLIDIGREKPEGNLYEIRTENYEAGTFIKHYLDENNEPYGRPVAEIPDFDARTRSWFTGAMSDPEELYRSEPYEVFTEDDISISTSRAVFSDQGEFLGVISCDVFLSDLSTFLSHMDIGINGFALITDPSGMIIAGSIDSLCCSGNGPLTIESSDDPVLSGIGEQVASRAGGFSGIREPLEFSLDNVPDRANCTVTPFTDSSGSKYFITVLIPDSDFHAYSGNFYMRTMIILAGTFVVVVLLSLLISYLVTRPILRLHGTATKLSEGQEAVFPASRIRELNDLSSVFGDLTSTLQKTNRELTEEIKERKTAENALAEATARMNMALEGTGAAIWDWDLVTGQIKVNDRWAELLGYEPEELHPVTVDTWKEFTHPEDYKSAWEALTEHFAGRSDIYHAEFRMRHKNGSWIWVFDRGKLMERDEEGNPKRMVGIHVDITRRKTAEIKQAQLQQEINKTRHLDSVGKLAGGVAHDLNNLLTPIIGYAELLSEADIDDEHKTHVKEILRAGESARALVSQLLAFGRKQYLELETVDLNKLIRDRTELIRTALKDNIFLNLELCDEPACVHGDESKLEQVLMNLVVNAGEAMPDGGTVELKTGIHQILRTDSTCPTGERSVLLMVRDTGRGISTEDQERIFDPFFSTKDDSGTGLGLSTVYGIVKQHGGEIDVESKAGCGTAFRIFLPFSEGEPAGENGNKPMEKDSGEELIMVVEDSPQVRAITEKTLATMGYKAVCASSGEEALELLKELEKKPDLMLTDVIMPGMSATELRTKARGIMPELKVVYMSGYSGDIVNEKDEKGFSIPFIQKPFTSRELIGIIEEVLKNL